MSEKEQPPIMDGKPCVNGCGFSGSSNTSHMCSKCWKDSMSQSMLDAEGKKDVNTAPLPPLAKTKSMDQEGATEKEQQNTQPSQSPAAAATVATPANTIPPPAPSTPTTVAQQHSQQTGIEAGASSPAASPLHTVTGATTVHVAPVVPVPVPMKLAGFPLSPVAAAASAAAAGTFSTAVPTGGGGTMLAATPVSLMSAATPAIGEGAAKAEGAVGAAGAAAAVAAAAAETPALPEQKNRKRCFTCSKKVGYTGIACRCNYVFCSLHRYPEQHACTFDFKTSDRNDLKRTVIGGGQFSKVDRL